MINAPAELQRAREALDGIRMTFRLLRLIQTVVVHSELLGRLDQAKVSFRTADRAAEGLGPVIDIVQPGELQPGIASTDIAAQPHLSVGLGERAAGEDDTARVQPCREARARPQSAANQLFACSAGVRIKCDADKTEALNLFSDRDGSAIENFVVPRNRRNARPCATLPCQHRTYSCRTGSGR